MTLIKQMWPVLTLVILACSMYAAQSQEIANERTVLGMLQGPSAKNALNLCSELPQAQQQQEEYARKEKESEQKVLALDSELADLRRQAELHQRQQPRKLSMEEKKHNEQSKLSKRLREAIRRQDYAIQSILKKRKSGYAYIQSLPADSKLPSSLHNNFASSVAKPRIGSGDAQPH